MTDSSSDCRIAAVPDRKIRWAHFMVLGAVCALVIWVYASNANSGLIERWGVGAADTYYNLLVRGFRNGQLNVEREVPPGLAALANPYDGLAAAPFRWIQGQPLEEMSYYQGKLYLYFGVTPALLLFWPYVALTGHYLLHKEAVVVFFSMGFLASMGLLWAVWRRYFVEVSFGVVVAGTLALGLAGFVPPLLQRCDIWEVAVSCGCALTMLALAGIWCALRDPARQGSWLAAASLAYGLAVGSRPSLLFGAVILLVPVARAWREKQRMWPLLLAAVGPIALVGLGLMLYNALRFGNPLEFGQRYQLNFSRRGAMQQFSLRYLWFNSRVAFLAPARWSGHFPFAHDITLPPLPKGGDVEHPFGVLTNIPLVWLALAAPVAWRSRSAEARATLGWLLATVALLFVTCALTVGLHNSMCLRYEVEFAFPLVWLAVIGIFGLECALASQPGWRRAARWGWALALAFSVAFNLLASADLGADTQRTLGLALLQTGRVDEAITCIEKALEIEPGDADAHNNLGNALLQKGRADQAMAHFQAALNIRPDYAMAHLNLGAFFLQRGRIDEAISHFQKVLETQPDNAEAHNNLANALLTKARASEAITHYLRALELRPDFTEAYKNLRYLAWVLATCPDASIRNGAKAVEVAQQENQLSDGKDPIVLGALAAGYADAGRFAEAAAAAERAIELATAQADVSLVEALHVQLGFYQKGTAFRDADLTGSFASPNRP